MRLTSPSRYRGTPSAFACDGAARAAANVALLRGDDKPLGSWNVDA